MTATLVVAIPASAEPTVIKDIDIRGTKRMSREAITRVLNIKPGDQINDAKVSNAIKRLYETGEIRAVEIYPNAGMLIIDIAENPITTKITIDGNKDIKEDKLRPLLVSKSGAPHTPAKVKRDVKTLREHYVKNGRQSTTVTADVAESSVGGRHITFKITEGKINKVSRISFVGINALPSRELRGVIRTVESSWLDVLKTDAHYDPKRLQTDKELLLTHYRKKGYADAKVKAANGQFDASTNAYDVTYEIDEGPRFTVGRVTIEEGNSVETGTDLAALLKTKQDAPFNVTTLAQDQRTLTKALIRAGYLNTRVSVLEDRDLNREQVHVTYEIQSTSAPIIEAIAVSGNTRTKDSVIRKKIALTEGKAFHPMLAEETRERISQLAYIKSTEIKAAPGQTPNTVLVTIDVEEDQSRVLDYGVAYSNKEGVIGDISIEERNLMGSGQNAKLKLIRSQDRTEIHASLTEPNTLGTDIAAGVDFAYKNADRSDESSFKSQSVGGAVRIGTQLTDKITGQASYKISRDTIYDVKPNASTAVKDAVTAGGKQKSRATTYTSAIGLTQTYDDRDHPVTPTRGTLISLGQDFAGVGGDVRYIRTSADLRTYYSPSERVTLAARTTAGAMTGWGGQDVRLLDSFYKGNELVRGFAPAGIGPRDLRSANHDALGGTLYWGVSLGANFDIPYVPKDLGVRGGVFADAGSLFRASNAVKSAPGLVGNSAKTRASVGASLIWDSPIGALRADYAVPILAQSFDKTQAFSFGVGQF